ncbi:MAG: hypothetical protein AMJ81_08590 [Phycisphaerae bacterium SM23_33]|nr:MAG: hypothetical protein AMJ81_08590 [Phycisphaerae bacterium SM23_33]
MAVLAFLAAAGLRAADGPNKTSQGEQDADWPCWRGPRGDARPTIRGITTDFSKGLEKLWEVKDLCQGENSQSWSAPSIQGERLVVSGRHGDDDVIFCLNADTGKPLWRKSYPAPGKIDRGSGPRATPCIDGDRVYTFGCMGHLACWGLADGKRLWMRQVEEEGGRRPEWGHASSPLIYQDKVIVQGGGTALVAAFEKMTGKLAWKSMTGQAAYAAPVLAAVAGKPQLIVFPAAGPAGLDPRTGRKLWTFPHTTPYDMNCATPILVGETLFIASAVEKNRGGCRLLKLSAAEPEQLWHSQKLGDYHSDPVILDGYIYCFSGWPQGNSGALKCLRLADGEVMWSVRGMGCGSLLYVDGRLMMMNNRGRLALLRPNPKGLEKLTEFQAIAGHPVWTTPVIARGKLYVRFTNHLICYRLKDR